MNKNKGSCPKCQRQMSTSNIQRHILVCTGFKICPVCASEYTGNSKTCGYSCANKLFRTGENNGNWKESAYRTTCFAFHKKACIICNESKIVSVHHINEDHDDNRPENLVPLCPTHHQYVHSQYRNEVQPFIDKYIAEFLGVA